MEYYLIHYPIKKNEEGISGGPFSMMIPREVAYVAFKTIDLAEYFMKHIDNSVKDYNFIKGKELGTKYMEIIEGVKVFLFFPTKEVIDELINNFKTFTFEDYLIAREDISRL